MKLAKRIILFLLINFLVILAVSTILSLFHVAPYLTAYGMNYRSLLIFCFIWGMVGALISLSLSRLMAKWMLNVQVISKANESYSKLIHMVERLSRDAGLSHCPQVGIFPSHQLNAFATGPTKKRSLVAVSSALLDRMNEEELEAILGHEISHIANGDMVTMTLLQGVVNAFVLFLSRALAYALSSIGKEKNGPSFSFYILTFVFDIVFMIFGSIVIAFFSRIREYRADRGGAILSSKEKMITALEKLRQTEREFSTGKNKKVPLQALMISTPAKMGLLHLFATHPPIENRIAKLKGLL